eukprot:PhM_4_TR14655/c0_g1_i1/m.22487
MSSQPENVPAAVEDQTPRNNNNNDVSTARKSCGMSIDADSVERAAEGAMPVSATARVYLEDNVMPVLNLALTALVRERPENPADFVAHFLLRHSQNAARTTVSIKPQSLHAVAAAVGHGTQVAGNTTRHTTYSTSLTTPPPPTGGNNTQTIPPP